MNAPKMFLGLAGAVVLATFGSAALVACSSNDSSTGGPTILPMVDSGNPNDGTTPPDDGGTPGDTGSTTDAPTNSDTGVPGCVPDGGASATCNSCAAIGHDAYNTCSSFGCEGHYDNAAHGVPNPLPTM